VPVAERPPLGVVVMAYGTPGPGTAVEDYYTDIRRGRPPSADQLADLVRRYDAIGGTSPLAERTEAQRAQLQRALDERAPGHARVVLGQKHAAPFIEDAVATLAAEGVERLVGLVLAPHWSRS
jgi:protoporphyrin/coproporphyrin ferrochelatase